jgi:hypothetical protein
MNNLHQLFPNKDRRDNSHCSNKIDRPERFESEGDDSRQLCEFISEMAFDLAAMSRSAGMNDVAQMLSLAALGVGLSQHN